MRVQAVAWVVGLKKANPINSHTCNNQHSSQLLTPKVGPKSGIFTGKPMAIMVCFTMHVLDYHHTHIGNPSPHWLTRSKTGPSHALTPFSRSIKAIRYRRGTPAQLLQPASCFSHSSASFLLIGCSPLWRASQSSDAIAVSPVALQPTIMRNERERALNPAFAATDEAPAALPLTDVSE